MHLINYDCRPMLRSCGASLTEASQSNVVISNTFAINLLRLAGSYKSMFLSAPNCFEKTCCACYPRRIDLNDLRAWACWGDIDDVDVSLHLTSRHSTPTSPNRTFHNSTIGSQGHITAPNPQQSTHTIS